MKEEFSATDYKNLFVCYFLSFTSLATVLLYTATFPQMTKDLNLTAGAVQALIPIYYVSYGITLLFCGNLSDIFGRRKIIIIALLVLITGSTLALFAKNLTWIYISRLVQGVGGSGTTFVAIAFIKDQFDKKKYKLAINSFYIIVSFSLGYLPIIGGFIQDLFSWHMNFFIILIIPILALFLSFYILPKSSKQKTTETHILAKCLKILSNKFFIGNALIKLLIYLSYVIYIIITPFVFQNQLNLSVKTYSSLILIPNTILVMFSILNSFLIKKYKLNPIMLLGIIIGILGCICLLIASFTMNLSIFLIIISLSIILFSQAIVMTTSTIRALKIFPTMAGLAASIFGFIQIEGTSLFGGIVSIFHLTTISSLAISLSITHVAILIIFILIMPKCEKITA